MTLRLLSTSRIQLFDLVNFQLQSFSREMSKKALVLVAKGTEEIEAVTAIDVLRRGEVQVDVGGLTNESGTNILCSRNVKIVPDISIREALTKGPYDIVVLPGGLGGTNEFKSSCEVGELLKIQEKEGRLVGAICAAPLALLQHGVFCGKSLTSYPAMEEELKKGNYNYKQDDVVIDGNLITSRGPGTATKFALTLVEVLVGKEKAAQVAKGMLVNY